MTEFQYENKPRIEELVKQFFGKDGKIEKINEIDKVIVCKYLLSYGVVSGRKISQKSVEIVKSIAIQFNPQPYNLVFFEKIEDKSDIIYFEEYMKKTEKSSRFLDAWYTWFEKTA